MSNIPWLIFGSWLIYYFLHSLLAADRLKSWFSTRWYRLVYSLWSTISIVPIVLLVKSAEPQLLFQPFALSRAIGTIVVTVGALVVLGSFRFLSGLEFLGFQKPRTEPGLVTNGLHARVRHPIYSGTVLVFLGMLIFWPDMSFLVSNLALIVYLPIGIFLEEKKLLKLFGEQYRDYKQRVPAIVPRLFL